MLVPGTNRTCSYLCAGSDGSDQALSSACHGTGSIIDDFARRGLSEADPEGLLKPKALAATTDRDSVLGRYSIDGFGDTTLSSYGVYDVRGGLPAFSAVLDSAG